MQKAKYISFFSYKNESINSFFSISSSFFLSQNGKKVLFVDLGTENFSNEIFQKSNDWLESINTQENLTNFIQSTTEPNLDILISNQELRKKILTKMEEESSNIFTSGPIYFFKEKFEDEEISNFYDFVIFNLPQDIDMITAGGLTSSSEMIVLIDLFNSPIIEAFSISMGILNLIRERFNRDLIFSKSIPIVSEKRSFEETSQEHLLNQLFSGKISKKFSFSSQKTNRSTFFDNLGKPIKIIEDFSFLF